MMDADDREAAVTEAARLDLAGVEHVWDGEKALGDAFAKTLGLTCSAWDVYMLYAPGITWEGDVPPEPAGLTSAPHAGSTLGLLRTKGLRALAIGGCLFPFQAA